MKEKIEPEINLPKQERERRELERNPETPELSSEAINLVTNLCFRPESLPDRADLIFVFSTSVHLDELGDLVKKLLEENISDKVMLSGGVPLYEDVAEIPKPESQLILDKIDTDKFPGVKFYTEKNSRNTKENVEESLKVLDFSTYKKILFIFKSHAAGRGYLTLKKHCPGTDFFQQTYNPKYNETSRALSEADWFEDDFNKKRVWGEFLRIKTYGEKGDIYYPDEVKDEVEKILKITKI